MENSETDQKIHLFVYFGVNKNNQSYYYDGIVDYLAIRWYKFLVYFLFVHILFCYS